MPRLPVYPFDVPDGGVALEVAPGVHWLRMPLPFALDHINLWLLKDGDGWTVVDTGYGDAGTRELWQTVLGSPPGARSPPGDRPVHRAIVTHFHPDHLGLAGWFHAEYGAQLWMTYPEWLQAHLAWSRDVTHDIDGWVDFFVVNGLDPKIGEDYKAQRSGFRDGTAPIPLTVRRIWDGDSFAIDGREWRVITGSGHSAEHAALFCPELNVLISGDQVLPRITTNISLWYTEPDGNPLRQYLESLEKFRGVPGDALVLPSHNRPFHGLHDRLDALIDHHADRLDVARESCAEGRNAVEVIPALFDRKLDTHQLGFAIGETLAHLNYLVADGSLRKYSGTDGTVRYERLR